MKLFEFQAKEAFAENAIPIPRGIVAAGMEEARAAIQSIGLPCVIKAQVLSGGRGKAGLIQIAKSAGEAEQKAEALFASKHTVRKLLIEEAVDIARELYLAVTIDPASATALFLACAEGGVEIEKLAVEDPDKIVTVKVDLDWGFMPHHMREITFGLGLEGEEAKQVGAIAKNLFSVFRKHGAELAEINPLFVTKQGGIVAGDGKLIIDDCVSDGKYPVSREYFDTDTEYEAAVEGIPYLQFDGDIASDVRRRRPDDHGLRPGALRGRQGRQLSRIRRSKLHQGHGRHAALPEKPQQGHSDRHLRHHRAGRCYGHRTGRGHQGTQTHGAHCHLHSRHQRGRGLRHPALDRS